MTSRPTAKSPAEQIIYQLSNASTLRGRRHTHTYTRTRYTCLHIAFPHIPRIIVFFDCCACVCVCVRAAFCWLFRQFAAETFSCGHQPFECGPILNSQTYTYTYAYTYACVFIYSCAWGKRIVPHIPANIVRTSFSQSHVYTNTHTHTFICGSLTVYTLVLYSTYISRNRYSAFFVCFCCVARILGFVFSWFH